MKTAAMVIRPHVRELLMKELQYYRIPTKDESPLLKLRKKLDNDVTIFEFTREEYEMLQDILSHLIPTPDVEGYTLDDWFKEN